MKRFLLSLFIPLAALPLWAQEVAPSPAESLDFTVGDITYTILDEQAKTCQTKAGYSYINYEDRKLVFVYGNNTTGAITIPSSVQKPSTEDIYKVVAIGHHGFNQASSVTISDGISQIGEYAFMDDESLTSISIPQSVTSIGRNAFYNCKLLTKINLPGSLSSIEPYTFGYSGLTSINIPESVVSIGENAFYSCTSLSSLTIPSTILQLGKSAFQSCTALTSLTINEGITSIPLNAFSGCNALTSLTIPASVNSIGDYGFNCSGLTSITCLSRTIPAISSNSFNSSSYSNATLNVYKTVLSNYQNSQLWGQFANIDPIELPATSISINPSTLNINVGLTGRLNAILDPVDATGEITWALVSASPANCIEVDASGLVTAKQMGSGRISATCGNQMATCDVIVNANPEESVVITPPVGDIYIGDKLTLSAVVFPTTITPSLTWSSSNTNVATIDSKTGELTALSDGATVITATNDNVSGSISIIVNPIEATSVTLNQQNVTLKVGGTQTLIATVMPETTTYKTVSWDSNDPSIVVVSDGVITAMGVGTATVRAMVGKVTANCTVTVNPIEAESITLNSNSETLKIGQSVQLTATVNPENTTDKTVTWVSSNPEYATVSTNGEITAISVGTATITAQCGTVTATCNVIVNPIESDELVMNYSAISLKVGSTQQLTAAIYPENTTDKTVTWSSSQESVATVSNGLVTALSVGETVITASNGTHSATCVVTVEPVVAEQVIIQESAITVNVGASQTLSAKVLPENVTDATITWSSLNPEIASISNGVVSGVAPGSAVITASCGSASASCNVTVLQPATSITLNETKLDLFVGDIFDLIETVMPANTTDVVTWVSSDAGVVSVDNNGIVTAIKAGNATVTASCGAQSATCQISVSDIVATSVTLDTTELSLISGQSYQITATVLPDNTTFPIVTWTSTDTSVATVANDGTVKAVGAGTATITATCGSVYGECLVTVTAPAPEEVVLNYLSYSLKATETVQLEVIHPSGLNAQDITWTSNNSKVATVSSQGLVTALGVGETSITASYNGESAICVITVNATEAENVALDATELYLEIGDSYQLDATVSPASTSNPSIVWSSNNTDVAIVSEDGEVTALSYGVATITAQCGNVYALCLVNVVKDASTGIESSKFTEDGFFRVFTLQGVNVMTTKEQSDLNKLIPGFYIINGHKVIIR